MGTKIPDTNGDGGNFAPTAFIREEGATLKGVMLGQRDVKTQYGPKPVFSFKVLDAECRFMVDQKEVQPEAGETVELFAPTRLARQLKHVTTGQTVTIKYAGKKKVGKGQPAHVFDVEVD